MGATLQVTLYSEKTGKIVKSYSDPTVKCISGLDVLTNGQVRLDGRSICR